MKKEAVFDIVGSKAPVTAIIGSGADMRLYPKLLPQALSTFPAATFREFNNQDTSDFSGASKFDFGYFDFQCFGRTADDAENLYEVLREELEEMKGVFAGVIVTDTFYHPSGAEDYLEEEELHSKQLEIEFSYRRLQS